MANLGIRAIKTILSQRLATYYTGEELFGIDEQKKYLTEFLTNTINSGEGNSLLIIGPRGSGKSALLEYVLNQLQQMPKIKGNFIHVHLNGFIHTDDWIALRSITEQLELENEADKMSFRSFSDALTFLLETLKSESQDCKPVLFTLDEFDLFCHHKRQTLVHNLFDLSQTSAIAVVGLTCNLNVIELFEKRMCSRFSYHKLDLIRNVTFQDYLDLTKHLLSLPKANKRSEIEKAWNKHIKELLEEKAVISILKKMFDKNSDICALKRLLRIPISKLNEKHPKINPSNFVQSYSLLSLDSKVAMLMDLSILEMSLVVAMLHLSAIQDEDQVNFEMVYKAYRIYARRKLSLHDFDKLVVFKAFEQLKDLELVIPVGEVNTTMIPKEFQLMKLNVEPMELQEVLQRYSSLPTEFKQWASSALTVLT